VIREERTEYADALTNRNADFVRVEVVRSVAQLDDEREPFRLRRYRRTVS